MTGTYSTDPRDWAPPGTPAFSVWLCGRCVGALINTDPRVCETCGARFHLETGEYLGGSGRPTDLAAADVPPAQPPGWDPRRPIGEQLVATVDGALQYAELARAMQPGAVEARAWALLGEEIGLLRGRHAAVLALAADAERRGGEIDPAAVRAALRRPGVGSAHDGTTIRPARRAPGPGGPTAGDPR